MDEESFLNLVSDQPVEELVEETSDAVVDTAHTAGFSTLRLNSFLIYRKLDLLPQIITSDVSCSNRSTLVHHSCCVGKMIDSERMIIAF